MEHTGEFPLLATATRRARTRDSLNPVARWALGLQGFSCCDPRFLVRASPWLRVAPGLTAALALAGALRHSAPLFWTLAVIGMVGAFGPGHPFDLPRILRRQWEALATPIQYPIPRRFAAALAAAWSLGVAVLLEHGQPDLAVAMAMVLVVSASLSAATHICPGSLVWHLLQRVRRSGILARE